MAPEPWSGRALRVLAVVAAVLLLASPPAHALRIVDYNILNYPGTTGPTRDPFYRTILAPISPDVLVTEETTSQAGVTEFLNSLNTMEPGQWAALPFIDGNDTDCALFYKPAKIGFAAQWSFYPDPTTNLRLVHVFRIRPAGYASNAADIRLYALHLKASQGSACTPINCETRRLNECIGLRDSMNAMPPGTHAFALGDFNFYTGSEPGLGKLLESQVNNTGQLYDPLGLQSTTPWQDNTSMQIAWTQSPCKTGDTGCASGASTGGLDDRFDLILPTKNWNDGQGYELVPGSYISIGNDGLHHNNSIQDPPTIPEGAAYATALHSVSDHLPVRVDLQVPAKISVPASLAFGTVIVGATATQNLAISNVASPPADALTYGLSPDPGFTAPLGTFNLSVASSPGSQPIGMTTALAGTMSGALEITSDDVDQPDVFVNLSGTVLDHAQASLDSTSALTSQTLDFGSHEAGGFSTLMARVHDRDYQSLRARLALSNGVITGGDGRFSIVGGFSPALVSGVARTHTVQFDDTNATPDTDYDGTLTFSSGDESLPGATAQPDLVVSLHAHVAGNVTGVPPGARVPTVTRFYPPAPNPLDERTQLRLDLARETRVSLAIYDLAGRRVTTIAEGTLPAGEYHYEWNGQSEHGVALGSGLYFARLTLDGAVLHTARLALVR
jgi:hypothetical protein